MLFINFCFQSLLKTANDCCRTEQQIQPDAWGSAHTTRVAQKCLHANCLQMIQKKQWLSNCPKFEPTCRYHVWKAMYEAFLKASPEAKKQFLN